MTLHIPGYLQWLEWVAGSEWPDGDEDRMWDLADELRSASDRLRDTLPDLDDAIDLALAAYSQGDGSTEMAASLRAMRSGEGSLEHLAELYGDLSGSAEGMGTEIQYAKFNMIASLAWLAAELAISKFSPFTSAAQDAISISYTRAAIQRIRAWAANAIRSRLTRLFGARAAQFLMRTASVMAREAFSEMIEGLSQELAVQGVQLLGDHRDGFDWDAIGMSAATGAFSGAAAGPVSGFVGDRLAGTALPGVIKGRIPGLTSALVGTAAGVGFTGALTGSFELDPRGLTSSLLSGGLHNSAHRQHGYGFASADSGQARLAMLAGGTQVPGSFADTPGASVRGDAPSSRSGSLAGAGSAEGVNSHATVGISRVGDGSVAAVAPTHGAGSELPGARAAAADGHPAAPGAGETRAQATAAADGSARAAAPTDSAGSHTPASGIEGDRRAHGAGAGEPRAPTSAGSTGESRPSASAGPAPSEGRPHSTAASGEARAHTAAPTGEGRSLSATGTTAGDARPTPSTSADSRAQTSTAADAAQKPTGATPSRAGVADSSQSGSGREGAVRAHTAESEARATARSGTAIGGSGRTAASDPPTTSRARPAEPGSLLDGDPTHTGSDHTNGPADDPSVTASDADLGGPPPKDTAPQRNDCAPTALRIVTELVGDRVVRVPDGEVGLDGMSAAELESAAGARLTELPSRDAVADQLLRLGDGATALLVEEYSGPIDEYGVGAHAFVMTNADGLITVHDPNADGGRPYKGGECAPNTRAMYGITYLADGTPLTSAATVASGLPGVGASESAPGDEAARARREAMDRLIADSAEAARERDEVRAAGDERRTAAAEDRLDRSVAAVVQAMQDGMLFDAGARPVADGIGVVEGDRPVVLVIGWTELDAARLLADTIDAHPAILDVLERPGVQVRELRVRTVDDRIVVRVSDPPALEPPHGAAHPGADTVDAADTSEPSFPADVSKSSSDSAVAGSHELAAGSTEFDHEQARIEHAELLTRRELMAEQVGELARRLEFVVRTEMLKPNRLRDSVDQWLQRTNPSDADREILIEIITIAPEYEQIATDVGRHAVEIGLVDEYDRLLQERGDLIKERELSRSRMTDRAEHLGVGDVTEWLDRDAAARDKVVQSMYSAARTDIVNVRGGIEQADSQTRRAVAPEEVARRTEAINKLVTATEEFLEQNYQVDELSKRLIELENAGVDQLRPPSAETAELKRMSQERGDELQRIKPRRGMRDDLAIQLGIVDASGAVDYDALAAERLTGTIADLEARLPQELRAGALPIEQVPDRLRQIEGLTDAATEVNASHNRIGRLQDEIAGAEGVWRQLIEGVGGHMVTDRVGLVPGTRPRIIVFGPRPDPAAPRADHDRAFAHALEHDPGTVQAVARAETTVEYWRVPADRAGVVHVEVMADPEIARQDAGWRDGSSRAVTEWRAADGNWHAIDESRPTWQIGRDPGRMPESPEPKDLPAGTSGGATRDFFNDISAALGHPPPGQIVQSMLPLNAPGAMTTYDTSGVPDGVEIWEQQAGPRASAMAGLFLKLVEVPQHPAVRLWLQQHPEVGKFLSEHPALQKFALIGKIARTIEADALDRDVQPNYRLRQDYETLNPAARAEIPPSLQREWDRAVAEWDRVQAWADSEYERFLADDTDVDRIVEGLAQYRQKNQEVAEFTREQIKQIKDHRTVDAHRVRDDRVPSGRDERRPMDRLADFAEAWNRLQDGKPVPQDIVLLHDSLIESDFLRANPGTNWNDANMYAAGLGYNWDADRPPLTGPGKGIPYAVHPLPPDPALQRPASRSGGPEPPPDTVAPAPSPEPEAPSSGGAVHNPEAGGGAKKPPEDPPAPATAEPDEPSGDGGTERAIGLVFDEEGRYAGGKLLSAVKELYAPYRETIAATGKRMVVVRFTADADHPPDWHTKMEASRVSAEQKVKIFESAGYRAHEIVLSGHTTEERFQALIRLVDEDSATAGIIVQYPPPARLEPYVWDLAPDKDIDALLGDRSPYAACATGDGIARIVTAFAGAAPTVAVVGARGFVGRGVVDLLRESGIEVITFDLGDDLRGVRDADIVVSATGNPRILGPQHLTADHVLVVDSGFVPHGGAILSDVRREAAHIPQRITPVPGGIGPTEMAIILERIVRREIPGAPGWRLELR